jgi:UDP-2,3-diacylglucosamine pyrophosphatase LpxH
MVGLVVNGDIVDFLAESPARYLDADGAIDKLKRIWDDAAFKPVLDALQAFVQVPNRRLAFVLGNHDVELALPAVRDWLFDQLADGSPEARGRLVSAMTGEGFSCSVGNKRVLCLHGNEVDGWNVVDYRALLGVSRSMARGESLPEWDANAGTRMVVDVMNPLKAKYPFVDLLKPEREAALPTLVALEPSAIRQLGRVAVLLRRSKKDKKLIEKGFLGVEDEVTQQATDDAPSEEAFLKEFLGTHFPEASGAAGGSDDVGDLLLGAQRDIDAGVDPKAETTDEEFLGLGDWFRDTVDNIRGNTSEYLRAALAKLLHGNETFEIDLQDEQFQEIDKIVGQDIDYVITGHTHLARALERRHSGTYYLNTGTWIRLMQLSPETLGDAKAFKKVFEAIQAGTIDALDKKHPATRKPLAAARPHVAVVRRDATGIVGELCEVDPKGRRTVRTHGSLPSRQT